MKYSIPLFALSSLMLTEIATSFVVTSSQTNSKSMQRQTNHQLQMAAVPPSESASVGIIGRGFVSVVSAKISALQGYDTFMLCPEGQEETIKELVNDEGDMPPNLTLISATDNDGFNSKIENADALIFAVDDSSVMDNSVIEYVLNPEKAKNLKRVVAMSRNLNGKGMNFAVKASRISANGEVWDMSSADQYKVFEKTIQDAAKACSAEYTIARAGTLKGGACGEDEFNQFLSRKFYDMTKKDIITWNLLFDCNVRGVVLEKGDVLPGPGFQAVFTATGTDGGLPGDTSRCGMGEAMVRSLAYENLGNMDFGVATAESREPPTDKEWGELFAKM